MAQRAAKGKPAPVKAGVARPTKVKAGDRKSRVDSVSTVQVADLTAMAPPLALPGPPPAEQPGGEPLSAQPDQDEPSSRLCVKNIPKSMTDEALKKLFSAKGEVTDVKVMRTRDGMSRQLAFVGFKSDQEAAAARKYFDNTYVNATRINVEFARSYKDPSLARPWSKHSTGSSANARALTAKAGVVDGTQAEAQALAEKLKGRAAGAGKTGKKAGGVLGEMEAADPKLTEFLALMAPRSRAKLWANDELAPEQTLEDLMGDKVNGDGDGDGDGAASSDEEYQELPVTAGDAGYGRLGGKRGDDDSDGDADGGDEDEEGDAAGGEEKDLVVVSEVVSDLDYLKSRMKKWNDDDGDEEEDEKWVKATGPHGAPDTDNEGAAGVLGGAGSKQQAKGGSVLDHVGVGVPMDVDEGNGTGAQGNGEGGKEGLGSLSGVSGADSGVGVGDGDGRAPIIDPEGAVRSTSRLFLRNLGYSVTETDLLELSGRYGDVASVHLVMERETKKSKGIAYVQYVMPDDAVKAYQQMDGTIFQGRLLHVLPAKAPPTGVVGIEEGVGGGRNAAGSTFKATREEQRKADAGNRAAWNSLFMRPDTVQEAVAGHYGVSKSELLDARANSDVAVRMALGEAAIIQQTKAALTEQGVNVPSLEAAAAAGGSAAASRANVARSPTVLLVKNLPYSTTEDALLELFSRSGPVSRLVLPPSHAVALVEYCEPQDARGAFKALAYKKFQHVPLYLEWAPRDIFTTPAPTQPLAALVPTSKSVTDAAQEQTDTGAKGAGTTSKKKATSKAVEGADDAEGAAGPDTAGAGTADGNGDDDDDDDDDAERTGSIYVKNLAFSTTDASLKKHFDKVVSAAGGVLHSARVSRRKHPSTGEVLSAGYGFVEVNSPEVAAAVIMKLQGSLLDHHKLSLQLSKRKVDQTTGARAAAGNKAANRNGDNAGAAGGTSAGGTAAGSDKAGAGSVSTKLVVRNVAFEATRKDLVGLFSPFGHLKSCRLPKKFDGTHRGFAFLEFVTKQEARNAVEGVMGTHLFGRRLVVEYAKEEGGLDELRAKTADKFKGDDADVLGGERAAKRIKKNL